MPFKFEVLLLCLAAVAAAGCDQRPAAVAKATPPPLHIVPIPRSMEVTSGELRLTAAAVEKPAAAVNAGRALEELLTTLKVGGQSAAAIPVRLRLIDDPALGDEGYRLVVDDAVTLSARTDTGLLHAVQSLRQLLPAQARGEAGYRLPRIAIDDVPTYRWRGSSVDVARSFLSIEYLKRHIDRMAMFKLNRLHLHLTDDQGWRIEIKRYPKLIEIGGASAVKDGRAGYYTQDQLKDLVAYAQARGVTIVPEIDMPGHVQAALASYNELACADTKNLSTYSGVEVGFSVFCLKKPEVVYPFVRNVLEEVIAIFPSAEIHIGGDEIKDPLYADFVARAAAMVDEMGRTAIAWEEGSVADTKPNVLLQLWNDQYPIDAAVAKGHPLILSPCSYLYIDHGNYKGQPGADWCRAEGVPLKRLYSFDPTPFKTAVGIEAALWTEYVHSDAAADERLWPRLAAVAELAWSPAAQRNYAGFVRRMGALRPQLDALGIHYHAEPDLGWGDAKDAH